jgi:uncharacterized membrane protein AbrB (regulator of aidB expression)
MRSPRSQASSAATTCSARSSAGFASASEKHALLAPAGPLAIGLAAAIAAAALGIPQRAPRFVVAVVAIVLLVMILRLYSASRSRARPDCTHIDGSRHSPGGVADMAATAEGARAGGAAGPLRFM